MAGNNDTGTGGINVDGDLYTMDVGVPDQQGGKQGQWSPGDVSVDNNVKDISQPTKETFAKYLSKKTLGLEGSATHPNAYPVGKGDQTTVTDIELYDSNGVPTKPYETNNESKFASVGIGAPPPDGMKRGYDPNLPNAKDGNALLPTAAVPAQSDQKFIKFTKLSEPVKKYTDDVLGGNLYREDPLDDKAVAEVTDGTNDFFGPKFLQVATSTDAGTFDNIAKVNDQKKVVTKATLQDYMRRQVTGKEGVPGEVSNKYLPPENNSDLFTNDPATGYPVAPKQTSANSDTSYEPKLASSYSDAASGLDSSFNRGKSINNYPDGNSVLKDAAPPATDGAKFVQEQNEPVKSYVSKVLEKNRFTSGRTFVPLGPDGKFAKFGEVPFASADVEGEARKTFEKNSAMAARSGMKMGEALPPEDEVRGYTFRRLAKVGNVLQLRATGEIIALDNRSVDPLDPITGLAAYAPGAGQAGAGVPLPIEQLNIENIINDLADPSNDSEDSSRFNGTLLNFSSKFEGVINSTFEKFSSFAPIGMIAMVTVMVVTITLAITLFGGLFGLTNNAIRQSNNYRKNKPKELNGRYGMGAFNGSANFRSADDIISIFLPTNSDSSQVARFFGLMPTHKESWNAVADGAKNFFGVSDDYNPIATFQSPGYYLTMARAIIRSVSQIVLACEEFGRLLATGNFTSGIEQMLELLLRIKNSRFVSVMNIFGQIGDANYQVGERATIKGLDNGEYFAASNGFPGRTAGAYGQGRYDHKKGRKLNWANDRAPTLLALPAKLKALSSIEDLGLDKNAIYADTIYKGTGQLANVRGSRTDITSLSAEGNYRISTEDREMMEEKFEAEYVPFYLHDLRTNEFLGFHAFLTNLGDSYTANYDSSEGFGRIDPVKVYKGTTRKIDVGFVMAATNPSDMTVMWDKINKLTTLVYPQMTQGKRLGVATKNGDYIFTKPYSQQIGASPMVRLRVGDLFKSNYSKFNIGRIFGMNDDNTVMGSAKFDNTNYNEAETKERIKRQKIEENYNSLLNSDIPFKTGDTVSIQHGKEYPLDTPKKDTFPFIKIVEANKNAIYFQIKETKISLEAVGARGGGEVVYVGNIVEKPTQEVSQEEAQNIKKYKLLLEQQNEAGGDLQLYRDLTGRQLFIVDVFDPTNTFTIKQSDIVSPSQTTKARIHAEAVAITGDPNSSSPPVDFQKSLVDFLSEDKNAIVRSFRSAGGKGLAGFIDSLSFDWNVGVWAAGPDDSGFTVPKMCKVTFSFTPIHDISPGLAHDGFNRAPIYPVGSFHSKLPKGKENKGKKGGE